MLRRQIVEALGSLCERGRDYPRFHNSALCPARFFCNAAFPTLESITYSLPHLSKQADHAPSASRKAI
jgi:hypothetical protein